VWLAAQEIQAAAEATAAAVVVAAAAAAAAEGTPQDSFRRTAKEKLQGETETKHNENGNMRAKRKCDKKGKPQL
jgi:hypothetical protein